MTHFIMVRHGEPFYDEVLERGYLGMGFDLGKLTKLGEEQAYKRAKELKLKDADIIISSPYTRALQTAAIISRETNIKLKVENDLHELMPDITHKFQIDNWDKLWKEFNLSKGVRTKDTKYPWESFEELKARVKRVLEKYKEYKKVIVVCHGYVMSSFTFFGDNIEHCGVREIRI